MLTVCLDAFSHSWCVSRAQVPSGGRPDCGSRYMGTESLLHYSLWSLSSSHVSTQQLSNTSAVLQSVSRDQVPPLSWLSPRSLNVYSFTRSVLLSSSMSRSRHWALSRVSAYSGTQTPSAAAGLFGHPSKRSPGLKLPARVPFNAINALL